MDRFRRILALIRMPRCIAPALCLTAGMIALMQASQARAQVTTQGENPSSAPLSPV